jgi:hypothetical protein
LSVGLSNPAAAASTSPSSPKPEWEINLKTYGFRTFRRGFVNDYGSSASLACTRGTVAVAFDSMGDYIGNSAMGQTQWSGSWNIVVLFFARDSAILLAKKSWLGDLRSELFATPDGNFILHLERLEATRQGRRLPPGALILLSPLGEELKRLDLPLDPNQRHEWWEVQASPSGQSLLLLHHLENLRQYQFYDADALEARSAWTETGDIPNRVISISDHQILRTSAMKGEWGGYLGDSESVGSEIAEDSRVSGVPRFLSSDLLIMTRRNPIQIGVLKPPGEEVFFYREPTGGAHNWSDQPIVSADGVHFAAEIDIGPKSFFSTPHVFIYIWKFPEPGPVQILQVSPPSVWGPMMMLSPEGNCLVIIDKAKLCLLRVP